MTKLTPEEFKVVCELFFNAGKENKSFDEFFNDVFQDQYKKYIEQKSFEEIWSQMQQEIESNMKDWDRQDAIRHANAIQDLAKFIIR